MSLYAHPSPANILELPNTWLAHLFEHVASGAGGLASAAALSQACKSFHTLSDSPAVTYRNLRLDKPLHSLGHPFFKWLAKRHGRIAGLTAELRLVTVDNLEQLQVMFGIPGLHLTLRYDAEITAPDELFVTRVLIPHGHLIDHLISMVHINGGGLRLKDFCKAAAPCRSLDLTVGGSSEEPVNLGALTPVADSLVRLNMESTYIFFRDLESASSLSSLSQLTSLSLEDVEFVAEEPWIFLGGLTNLKQLSLWVVASGDPTPLSRLTGLSSLDLRSFDVYQDGLFIPGTFSSLQSLSTLQQLKELKLHGQACSVTSLHGLAELSRLETLRLDGSLLRSLEGISRGLTSLTVHGAGQLDSLAGVEHVECCRQLRQLSGIEGLTALQQLEIYSCGVTSLQPVGQLVGGLEKLHVSYCCSVIEEVLQLPHVQPTADVRIVCSNVKEVVLAGGVRGRVGMLVSSEEEEEEEAVIDSVSDGQEEVAFE